MKRLWFISIPVAIGSVFLFSVFQYSSNSPEPRPNHETAGPPGSETVSPPTPPPMVNPALDEPQNHQSMQVYIDNRKQQIIDYKTSPAVLIGTYVTFLGAHNDANRVHNIRLSLASINRTVLMPGEEFSFHQTIGDSTNGNLGYKPAPVIIGKEFATDFGGGICQVSSTLYNAVARAGLEITERYSHSLPVDYVPTGRDATVSYPDLDFKFVNNSKSPIRIECALQGEKVITNILKIQL